MTRLTRSAVVLALLPLAPTLTGCSGKSRDTGKADPAPAPKEKEPVRPPAKPKDTGKSGEVAKAKDPAEPPKAKAKEDADLIQGTWRVEAAVVDGKNDDVPADAAVIFRGDKMIIRERVRETDPFRLDPTKTPKAIDVGSPKDSSPGIYELDGDRLRICLVRGDGARPTALESKPGTNHLLLVLRRDKNVPAVPDVSAFPAAIVGKWKWSGGETAFPFFRDTEFTNDGRVLQLDPSKKEWVERYTYRFDKADLVLTPSGKKDGGKEERVTVDRITADEFVADRPSGTLRRLK
jgi:uncharacterized protein (TIGR03067 family)